MPRRICELFRELRNNYRQETPGSREFIVTFLKELKTVYRQQTVRPHLPRKTIPADLAFSHARIAGMVKDFSLSTH